MKILVIGSGGREHALAWRLGRDPDASAVLAAPGNPGMAALGPCFHLNLSRPDEAVMLARREGIDLTVVGPEAALDRGIADAFEAAGLALLGPSRLAARLECSKVFAKAFMARHGIPTARYVACDEPEAAIDALSGDLGFPVVVKADGLAAGKGVVIAADRAEAETAIRAAMVGGQFGEAGSRVVLEECLTGPEVSFFALCDGRRAVPIGSAQDHKRIFDGDQGPNTGGMGAFAPSPLVTGDLSGRVMRDVVEPVLAGMAADGTPYRGFLYVSLMLTSDGPKVIEFNVRFGDPEAQVVLPLIDGPLVSRLHAAATGALDPGDAIRLDGCAVGVVLASAGYPASPEVGRAIGGVAEAEAMPGTLVFHAGTRLGDGGLLTAGGRVLTVVGRGATFADARRRAYDAAAAIRFEGMQFRRDIGVKALEAGNEVTR
ncbi:MAG: phosphoribosylamine--glycine ligase [Vicinamibacterales bacterium]